MSLSLTVALSRGWRPFGANGGLRDVPSTDGCTPRALSREGPAVPQNSGAPAGLYKKLKIYSAFLRPLSGGARPAPHRRSRTRKSRESNGYRYREVVQRREGLRLHHAGRRGRRRVLPPHRHPGRRVPHPRRGPEGGVRRDEGPEGPPGRERPRHLIRFARSPRSPASREVGLFVFRRAARAIYAI